MKYYYEYKRKNGAKVGGHNLEDIKFNDDIIILTGEDTINSCFGEIDRPWRTFLKTTEIEYLKIEPMEEDKDIELLNLDTDKLKGKEVIRAIDYLLEGRINELVKEVNKLRKENNNG